MSSTDDGGRIGRRLDGSAVRVRANGTRGATLRAALVAAACVAGSLDAGVVLERHANSLTTFRTTTSGATTPIQGVRPNVNNRVVAIDGSGNWPQGAQVAPPGSGLNPDPYAGSVIDDPGSGGGDCGDGGSMHIWKMHPPMGASSGAPKPNVNGIDLSTGALRTEEVDIRLPAPGFSWTVARSYSAAQTTNAGAIDSDGYQGRNWFQDSQPEVMFYDDATDSEDMVYVVWGAAAFSEFKRRGSSSVFAGVNGSLGLVEFSSGTGGEPDLWTLTNADGFESKFFASGAASGQLWKITDPAGNVAYVGDATTASTAVTNGYSSGRITKAYDAADRRYTYTYSTIDGVSRLTEVKAETRTGGTWASPTGLAEVAKVEYS